MLLSKDWKEYECIDASLGMKYERWGNLFLLRPDPQVIWDNGNLEEKYRGQIDAIYHRSSRGGGSWEFINLPKTWQISYNLEKNTKMVFNLKPFTFKHTGIFPEQATNWKFIYNFCKNSNKRDYG